MCIAEIDIVSLQKLKKKENKLSTETLDIKKTS